MIVGIALKVGRRGDGIERSPVVIQILIKQSCLYKLGGRGKHISSSCSFNFGTQSMRNISPRDRRVGVVRGQALEVGTFLAYTRPAGDCAVSYATCPCSEPFPIVFPGI